MENNNLLFFSLRNKLKTSPIQAQAEEKHLCPLGKAEHCGHPASFQVLPTCEWVRKCTAVPAASTHFQLLSCLIAVILFSNYNEEVIQGDKLLF